MQYSEEKTVCVHLRYSHSAERLRMHNIYSNLNNIRTFTLIVTQQVGKTLSFSLFVVAHVFNEMPRIYLKRLSPLFQFRFFFFFFFCRPSNGNQLRINVFHSFLVRLENSLTNKKKNVQFLGVQLERCESKWYKRGLFLQNKS